MIRNADRFFKWTFGLRIAVIFAYLCIAPIVISLLANIELWWRDFFSKPAVVSNEKSNVQSPAESHGQPNVDIHQLAKRVEQLENDAKARLSSTA